MEIETYLDSLGEKGCIERIEAISRLNLGERSEAAQRVCEKRSIRQEWMDKGLTFEQACLIVNNSPQ